MGQKKNSNTKAWGGRFQEKTDNLLEKLSVSVHFDKRLALHDIRGSQAHAKMLAAQNIISKDEGQLIVNGLENLKEQIISNQFVWDPALEDVHMNIEKALIKLIGEAGEKLHTARSRNDQVALDVRLYLKEAALMVGSLLKSLRVALAKKADEVGDAPMPGYTHLQRAQPVLLAHHLMAYYHMISRDQERLRDLSARFDFMPLGSGALSGTGLPIDPALVAKELNFTHLSPNSLDAVSSRDHLLEFLSFASILMVHLSRLAEDLILWCSQEFAFAELPDSLSTGSSMMPQKKNPDGAELTRGKSGRVIGNLVSLLTVLKGLPLSYNRDLQEDKEPLFDSIDTLELILPAAAKMIEGLSFNYKRLYEAANDPYSPATDLADHLVLQGVPFRTAHSQSGQVVRYAIDKNKKLVDLSLDELKMFCPQATDKAIEAMHLENMLKARHTTPGGTAPIRVKEQINKALEELGEKK